MEYTQRIDNIRLIEVRAIKKWITIGILAGLVIGMVLMSGCTQNKMIKAGYYNRKICKKV